MSLSEPYHVTIEIVNDRCHGLRMLESSGVGRYTLSDVRSLPGGSTRHLIKIPKEHTGKIPEGKFSKISSGEAWFDSDGCDVCNTVLSHKSFLVSARHISDYTIVYNFVVPNHEAFRSIVSTLEDRGLEPKVLEVTKFKPKMEVLTEKQERVLWLALKLGFFDYPRKIDSIEFSKKLGIVPSTLSEMKRRGIRKLLKHYFEA
jgi:hypothetical protein